jgi:hypothetical protein
LWIEATVHGLQLHDQTPLYQEIKSPFADRFPLVDDRDRLLTIMEDFPQSKLHCQRILIHPFKEIRPKMPMHLDRCSDHSMSQLIEPPLRLNS